MPAKSDQGCSSDDDCCTGVNSKKNEHAAACCYLLGSCNSGNNLNSQHDCNMQTEAWQILEGSCRDDNAVHCCTRYCRDMNGNKTSHCVLLDCAKCCESPHRKRNRRRMARCTQYKSNTKKRKRETGHVDNSSVHSQQDTMSVNVTFKRLPEDEQEEDVSLNGSVTEPPSAMVFHSRQYHVLCLLLHYHGEIAMHVVTSKCR